MVIQSRCAREDQSLLFDLCKAFDGTESSHKLDFILLQKTFFLHTCAACHKLPSNIKTLAETILAKEQQIRGEEQIE